MRSRSAAMAQDVRARAARFRKGVGQLRQPLEGTGVVDGLGEGFHFGGKPRGVEGAGWSPKVSIFYFRPFAPG